MKTLPIRVLGRLLMITAYIMFLAALIRADLELLTHTQAGIRVTVWLTLTVISAGVSDAIETQKKPRQERQLPQGQRKKYTR
ncbi:hypothetical protein [Peptococcus simiae]|uniref:hypothetical protein n=1 Tax=Peptococcus simiae TaxID=1643805 RepID=UPI00398085B9